MNRDTRRKMNKKLGKKYSKEEYDILETMLATKGIKLPKKSEQHIKDDEEMEWDFSAGDKVKLDADKILNRKIGNRIKYRNFVKRNKDTVFTLESISDKDNHLTYTFAELDDKKEVKWHFNVDELILVEKGNKVNE